MNIQEVKTVTEEHFVLLLDADPAKKLVEEYVSRSTVFEAVINAQTVGIIVLLPTRPETIEIVNIATAEKFRGKGVATAMIQYALEFAKEKDYQTIEIGTGSIGFEQLYLYQKCGFRMMSIDRDFFVRHYEEKIVENGLVLKDMVRLSQDL